MWAGAGRAVVVVVMINLFSMQLGGSPSRNSLEVRGRGDRTLAVYAKLSSTSQLR